MADKDLINDELERVYKLYGERTKQCGRGLYALIIAGLAVFVVLVVPYLTFRAEVADTRAAKNALQTQLQAARALVAQTEAAVDGARKLQDEVAIYYQEQTEWQRLQEMEQEAAAHAETLAELRADYAHHEDPDMAAWVRGEVAAPPKKIVTMDRRLYSLSFKPCYWESALSHVSCRLCEDFTRRHEVFAGSISRLPAVEETLATPAKAELEQIAERACGWLTRGEVHWRRDRPFPGDNVDRLRGWLSFDLMAYLERFQEFEQGVDDSLDRRRAEVANLRQELAATSAALTVLEAQLERVSGFDRLGTPVGDLPVGLGQLVLLFPVILAVGFLVVANSHARAAQTQRAFVRLCRKRDGEGEVIDATHIAAVAPAWLDRRQPPGALIVKWGILVTPLALALASLWLIHDTGALTSLRPDDAAIAPGVYLLFYLAALALFAGTLWYLWQNGRGLAPGEGLSRETAGEPVAEPPQYKVPPVT